MSYAILRFEKNKGGKAGTVQAHNERQKENYHSNPDIDKSKSQENYHLVEPQQSYRAEIETRINEARCRVRKDSVKFVETLITTSPDFMDRLKKAGKEKLYFKKSLEFITQNVWKGNIFSAVVHMDEKTPHMHVCFVPLTDDGRLSAKDIIGNRTKLMQWQDKYYEHMAKTFPKLERGKPAVQTGRDHIPMWMFKKATKLTKGMEKVKQAIQDIGKLKTAQKREEAIEVLSTWFSETQNFIGHVESLKNFEQDLRKQKRKAISTEKLAENKVQNAENEINRLEERNDRLWRTMKQQERLINQVPQEVWEQMKKARRRDEWER